MDTTLPDDPHHSSPSAQDLRQGSARSAPWLLRQVSQRYGSVVAARLREAELAGLPRPGYWLLMALASGARDATQLVEAIGVSKQAVSKVVDVLVGEGFVVRQTNDEDRRRTDLVLTSKGRRTVEVVRTAVRAAEHVFVEEVGAAAWDTTVATLATLAAFAVKERDGDGGGGNGPDARDDRSAHREEA